MSISRYGSIKMTGSHPNKVPDGAGDLFYEQDRARDFAYLMDRIGLSLLDVLGGGLVSGGVVTPGSSPLTQVNISAAVAYAPFTVSLGYTNGVPPQTQDEDVSAVRIASALASDVTLTGGLQGKVTGSATLDGSTPNLVKLRYIETDSLSRNRAKVAGSWYFAKEPDWAILISSAAATAYDVLLATIVGNGSSFLTITPVPQVSVAQLLRDLATRIRMEAQF